MRLAILCLLVLTACATAKKINRVSLGMTKDQVIDNLGEPDSSKGKDNREVLVYEFIEDAWTGREGTYWVELQSGKVVWYGKAGDFGSSEGSKHTIELNQKVQSQ